jgi:hypothetical protein
LRRAQIAERLENAMKNRMIEKTLGWLLSALLAVPLAGAMPRQQAGAGQPDQSLSSAPSQSQNPGLETRPPANADQSASAPGQSNSGAQPGNRPVGAAAAPYENPSGVAASRPAGAVIAPAKQRRRRSIFIKIGIVVGAGAAVAAVALLSRSSSSRP